MYATISPVAAARPVLRALERPRLGVRTTWKGYSCAMLAVMSVEPSSTTITSKSGYSSLRRPSRHARIVREPL